MILYWKIKIHYKFLISCMNDIIKQSEENKKKNGNESYGQFRKFWSKINEYNFKQFEDYLLLIIFPK